MWCKILIHFSLGIKIFRPPSPPKILDGVGGPKIFDVKFLGSSSGEKVQKAMREIETGMKFQEEVGGPKISNSEILGGGEGVLKFWNFRKG